MRKSLCLLLIVVAGLLTFPASLAAWEQRVLINEDGFVSMGNKVLSRKEIQEELANEIAKDVGSLLGPGLLGGTRGLLGGSGGLLNGVPGGNDITGLLGSLLGDPAKPATPGKPAMTPANGGIADSLIKPIALEVLASLPNSEVSDLALQTTHESVVAAVKSDVLRAEKNSIVLDLGPEVGDVIKELNVLSSSKTPTADAGKIVLLDPTDLATVFRLAQFLDGKTLVLSFLPLAALAAALIVAPNRRLVPLYAGIAIAGSAGLWILVALGPLKPWVTNRVAENESERRVAHAAYDVITASYIQQELIVMAVGAVVVVAGIVLVAMTNRRSAAAIARST